MSHEVMKMQAKATITQCLLLDCSEERRKGKAERMGDTGDSRAQCWGQRVP